MDEETLAVFKSLTERIKTLEESQIALTETMRNMAINMGGLMDAVVKLQVERDNKRIIRNG